MHSLFSFFRACKCVQDMYVNLPNRSQSTVTHVEIVRFSEHFTITKMTISICCKKLFPYVLQHTRMEGMLKVVFYTSVVNQSIQSFSSII